MWDHTSIPGMLGEVPMRLNRRTGKMEPVDLPGGEVHGDWIKLPYPAKQGEIAGIFSPFNPFNWGRVPEVREQVQKGEYNPDVPVVSPVDQFLRGVSERNKVLDMLND